MTTLPLSLAAAKQAAKDIQEQRKLFVSTILTNKEIPLNDRWGIFLALSSVFPVDPYIPRSMNFLTEDVYDNFFPDRRGIHLYRDIDEQLVDNVSEWLNGKEPGNDYDRKWSRIYLEMYAKRDEWREAVLAEGNSGFCFDW